MYSGDPQSGLQKKYRTVLAAGEDGTLKFAGGQKSYKKGQIITFPPSSHAEYAVNTVKMALYLNRAVVQNTGALIFDDNQGEVYFAMQAAKRRLADGNDCKLTLSALGDLIAGYIAELSGAKKFSPVTVRITEEIENNLSNPGYSLEDGIKKLPLNYDYVRKLFKKETGVTPHEYLLEKRMELASSIILGNMTNRYSNYTVSQISESCGFSEPLYFSRVFKKYFGTPPSEYGKN